MLSSTWEKHRHDPFHRQKLFRGMARLTLSLANIPQPRIGSFQFHTDGTITLTNRPLLCSLIILENDGALRTIQRNETYTCFSWLGLVELLEYQRALSPEFFPPEVKNWEGVYSPCRPRPQQLFFRTVLKWLVQEQEESKMTAGRRTESSLLALDRI